MLACLTPPVLRGSPYRSGHPCVPSRGRSVYRSDLRTYRLKVPRPARGTITSDQALRPSPRIKLRRPAYSPCASTVPILPEPNYLVKRFSIIASPLWYSLGLARTRATVSAPWLDYRAGTAAPMSRTIQRPAELVKRFLIGLRLMYGFSLLGRVYTIRMCPV